MGSKLTPPCVLVEDGDNCGGGDGSEDEAVEIMPSQFGTTDESVEWLKNVEGYDDEPWGSAVDVNAKLAFYPKELTSVLSDEEFLDFIEASLEEEESPKEPPVEKKDLEANQTADKERSPENVEDLKVHRCEQILGGTDDDDHADVDIEDCFSAYEPGGCHDEHDNPSGDGKEFCNIDLSSIPDEMITTSFVLDYVLSEDTLHKNPDDSSTKMDEESQSSSSSPPLDSSTSTSVSMDMDVSSLPEDPEPDPEVIEESTIVESSTSTAEESVTIAVDEESHTLDEVSIQIDTTINTGEAIDVAVAIDDIDVEPLDNPESDQVKDDDNSLLIDEEACTSAEDESSHPVDETLFAPDPRLIRQLKIDETALLTSSPSPPKSFKLKSCIVNIKKLSMAEIKALKSSVSTPRSKLEQVRENLDVPAVNQVPESVSLTVEPVPVPEDLPAIEDPVSKDDNPIVLYKPLELSPERASTSPAESGVSKPTEPSSDDDDEPPIVARKSYNVKSPRRRKSLEVSVSESEPSTPVSETKKRGAQRKLNSSVTIQPEPNEAQSDSARTPTRKRKSDALRDKCEPSLVVKKEKPEISTEAVEPKPHPIEEILKMSAVEAHDFAKKECKKLNPDFIKLSAAMDRTYERFRKVTYDKNNVSVPVLLKMPGLKFYQMVKDEYGRIKGDVKKMTMLEQELLVPITKALEPDTSNKTKKKTRQPNKKRHKLWDQALALWAEKKPDENSQKNLGLLVICFEFCESAVPTHLFMLLKEGEKPDLSKISTPRIVMNEADIFAENPEIFIYVEEKRYLKVPSVYEAMLCCFSLHYILNINYNNKLKPFFEFLDLLNGNSQTTWKLASTPNNKWPPTRVSLSGSSLLKN